MEVPPLKGYLQTTSWLPSNAGNKCLQRVVDDTRECIQVHFMAADSRVHTSRYYTQF
jgi:hypothetical protein